MSIVLHHNSLNGKHIAYSSQTEFLIQLGKGSKGGYLTRMTIKGNLALAVSRYNALNIGNGYKKRLVMPSASRNPVLHKSQLNFDFMPKTVRQVKATVLAQASS